MTYIIQVNNNKIKFQLRGLIRSTIEKALNAMLDRKNEIHEAYKDVTESAMLCLDEGFDSSMSGMELPAHLRKFYCTSNHIERLNKKMK